MKDRWKPDFRVAALATMLAILGAKGTAAATPEQTCIAGMNDVAGKYAACLAKAEKSLAAGGDSEKYAPAIFKCEQKLTSGWNKLEGGAILAGTVCPSAADEAEIGDFWGACSTGLAEALGGGDLPVDVVQCHDDLVTCGDDSAACDDDLVTAGDELSDCQSESVLCEAALVEPLPATGQTICYDNGDGTPIACAGTGQDGELQGGAPAYFTDNGDGTITDSLTGLMWEKMSDDGSIHDKDTQYTFANALGKAVSLNGASFAGHTDWRVPNIRELESLADLGRFNPAINPVFHTGCTPGCTVLTCSCTRSNVFHSSTAYRDSASASWRMNSTDGDVYAGAKADLYHVRAVRTAD